MVSSFLDSCGWWVFAEKGVRPGQRIGSQSVSQSGAASRQKRKRPAMKKRRREKKGQCRMSSTACLYNRKLRLGGCVCVFVDKSIVCCPLPFVRIHKGVMSPFSPFFSWSNTFVTNISSSLQPSSIMAGWLASFFDRMNDGFPPISTFQNPCKIPHHRLCTLLPPHISSRHSRAITSYHLIQSPLGRPSLEALGSVHRLIFAFAEGCVVMTVCKAHVCRCGEVRFLSPPPSKFGICISIRGFSNWVVYG